MAAAERGVVGDDWRGESGIVWEMDVEDAEEVDEGLEWLEVVNDDTDDELDSDRGGGCWRLEAILVPAIAKAGMGGDNVVGVGGTTGFERDERGPYTISGLLKSRGGE